MPVFGTIAVALQRRRRDRAVPGDRRQARGQGTASWRRARCRRWPRGSRRRRTRSCPPARVALPRRDRRDRARLPRAGRSDQARIARERQQLRAAQAMLHARQRAGSRSPRTSQIRGPESPLTAEQSPRARRSSPRSTRSPASATRSSTRARSKLLDMWPQTQGRLRRRRVRGEDPRQGDPHGAHHRRRCPAPRCARSRCPATRTTARSCAGSSRENVPGSFPFTARRLRVQARERGSRRACSPARATRSAPTGASTCWPTACRPSACRPPSTRSRSTATTPPCAPTSTARSATRACRSPRSTT